MAEPKNDWNTPEGKKEIYLAVMRHLHANPADMERCLDSDFARKLVADKGNTDIPESAKVVFLNRGDLSAGAGGAGSSLIIEIPPADFTPDDPNILDYAACTYPVW